MSQASQTSSRAQKQARFSKQRHKKAQQVSPWVVFLSVVGALVLVGGAFVLISTLSRGATAALDTKLPSQPAAVSAGGAALAAATVGHNPYPEATADGTAVRLPLATVSDGQAHYYTYMNGGRPIEFFVVKGPDGVLHTAFNACDVCFPARKGYHQEGNEMVCNNCGRRFPIEQIGQVWGGCNPSPLRATVSGDTVTIQVQDLAAGSQYFN